MNYVKTLLVSFEPHRYNQPRLYLLLHESTSSLTVFVDICDIVVLGSKKVITY